MMGTCCGGDWTRRSYLTISSVAKRNEWRGGIQESVPVGFWTVEIRFLDKLGTTYKVISSVATTGDLLMKIPVTPSKGKPKHQRKWSEDREIDHIFIYLPRVLLSGHFVFCTPFPVSIYIWPRLVEHRIVSMASRTYQELRAERGM